MRNLLLAMLTAGLLAFGWTNCVTNLATATPIQTPSEKSEEQREGNHIGMSARAVMNKLGSPTGKGQCEINVPSGNGLITVIGDAAEWHTDGATDESMVHVLRNMCAVFGTVVSEHLEVSERTADGEQAFSVGATDYNLIRRLLENGPEQDGEDGKYILRPGEIAI